MYCYEDKIRAISTLKQVDFNYKEAVNILGYPNSAVLRKWFKEYKEKGDFLKESKAPSPLKKKDYSMEEKKRAVDFYIKNGRNISRTIRCLGYPSRILLASWLNLYSKDGRRIYSKRNKISKSEETDLVLSFLKKHKDIVETVFKLTKKDSLLYNEDMKNKDIKELEREDYISELLYKIKDLEEENNLLKRSAKDPNVINEELKRLQSKNKDLEMELDIIKTAEKLLKKERGINYKNYSNREKAMLVNALSKKYIKTLLFKKLDLKKRTYYNIIKTLDYDKYSKIREIIRKIFYSSNRNFGYRRIQLHLQRDYNINLNVKTVRKLIRQEKLNVIYYKKKSNKYSSYKGEKGLAPDNIVNRNFHSNKPNELWLTDITEFKLNDNKLYLSPIIDCFDGKVLSYSISSSPNQKLANSSLNKACRNLKKNEYPIIHSDRGIHYQWKDWKDICDKYNLIRSMSRKGNCADNSACEGFFGRLKNEFFYYRDWKNISSTEFIAKLSNYIDWYNNKRRKVSLGGLTIAEYREKYYSNLAER